MDKIIVTFDNIHIIDSYKIFKKSDMLDIIRGIREEYKEIECLPLIRYDKSLVNEWMAHNLCYDLHILRSHTKDVDLNANNGFMLKFAYNVASIIYRTYSWLKR